METITVKNTFEELLKSPAFTDEPIFMAIPSGLGNPFEVSKKEALSKFKDCKISRITVWMNSFVVYFFES